MFVYLVEFILNPTIIISSINATVLIDIHCIKSKMFGNFKEKIHNVQHDLSLGWRNLADKAKSVNKKIARKATLLSDGDVVESEDDCFICNLEAGGDILRKYQLDWSVMHNRTLQTAQKAAEVDKVILEVSKKCQSVNDTISTLYSELSVLPNLLAQLEVTKSDLAALSTQVDILEELMIDFEDVCERQEIERKKALHNAHISNLQVKTKTEYQDSRAQLEKKRLLAEERKMKLERQASVERQHIFEDAFVKQMEYYTQFGITEKPIVDQPQEEHSLADISIDDSELYHEFMDFLGPETQEPQTESPVEEASDLESDQDNTNDSGTEVLKESDIQGDSDIQSDNTDSSDHTQSTNQHNLETHEETGESNKVCSEEQAAVPPSTCKDAEQSVPSEQSESSE